MNQNNHFINDPDWLGIQKKYMDALMVLSNLLMSKPENNPTLFWVNAIEKWWQSVKEQDTSYRNKDWFEKITDQYRSSFMSGQFSSLLENMPQFDLKKKDWNSFINEKIKETELAWMKNQTNFKWDQLIDVLEHPIIKILKSMFLNTPFDSANILSDITPETKQLREQFLSVFGIGYNREMQEKIQQTIKLWIAYQDNYQEYQIAISTLSYKALDAMRKKILHMIKEGEDIKSMKQIYDLWIEANEKVYGEYVLTDEYANLNGRLVNSLMAFKKKSHEIIEKILLSLNMPTNQSLNTLERRQYELRKQVKELKNKITEFQKENTNKKSTSAVAKKVRKSKSPTIEKRKKTTKADSDIVEFRKNKKKINKNKKKIHKTQLKKKVKNESPANTDVIEIKL